MNLFSKRALAVALAMAIPATALATNGMFMVGYSAKSVGMGGTAIAFPQDSLAGAVNPAAIGAVGTRFDLDATLLTINAQATLGNANGDVTNSKSRANTYLLPGIGFSMPVDRETTFGFSMVGAGGGGTHYKQNFYDLASNSTGSGTAHTSDLGVELMIMQMNPTMAQKVSENNIVGGSLIMGLQRFHAYGLGNFAKFTHTQTDNSLTDRGVEYSRGLGVRLGWLGTLPSIGLTLGAVATSKVYMSRFQNYSELFAENGDIDTPASLGAGAALKITPKLTVAMDISRTYYTKVKSIANRGPKASGSVYPDSQEENSLGLDEGLGFHWRDQTVYKLGVNYERNSKWTWRAGWNYGRSPVDQDNDIAFSMLAPAITQTHAMIGATNKLDKNTETSFAWMHAFGFQQSGPTYIGGTGTIKMSQNAFGVNISFFY